MKKQILLAAIAAALLATGCSESLLNVTVVKDNSSVTVNKTETNNGLKAINL